MFYFNQIGTLAFARQSLTLSNAFKNQQRTFARASIFDIFARGGFGKADVEEKDPGEVVGTNLRVLKYPNPKVHSCL
jgi:hypothetical protein